MYVSTVPSLVQVSACNTQPCGANTDCQVSAWSPWSSCSASCGSAGTRQRQRVVTVPAAGTGAVCPVLVGEERCNTHACGDGTGNYTCTVSAWSEWSECPVSCQADVQVAMGGLCGVGHFMLTPTCRYSSGPTRLFGFFIVHVFICS